MDKHNDEIGELLESFNKQKESRDRREIEPLEPPKKRSEIIDFAKKEDQIFPNKENDESVENTPEETKKAKAKKEPKPKKTPEQIAEEKERRKEIKGKIALRIKAIATDKRFFIPVIAIVLIAVIAFSSVSIVNYNKTAYLKPYQEKYPSVQFPVGIMEKYCDDFGKNPSLQGYMKIDDISLDVTIDALNSQVLVYGAERFNYVVYLDDNKLESIYSTIDGYNNSTKKVEYTDLINEYTFEVVGAFYTNTREEDDNGYIFPYDTTEKMTLDSMNQYIDRITTRLTYKTNDGGITRTDTLLTISCPTDYKKDYRFVVVCKAVDEIKPDLIATEKEYSHLTQIEYDEKGEVNPYRFASKWYPEIIITNPDGNTTTIKRSIDYYRK